MNNFEKVIEDLKEQLNKITYNGELSDVGNEIGLVIGKHLLVGLTMVFL